MPCVDFASKSGAGSLMRGNLVVSVISDIFSSPATKFDVPSGNGIRTRTTGRCERGKLERRNPPSSQRRVGNFQSSKFYPHTSACVQQQHIAPEMWERGTHRIGYAC